MGAERMTREKNGKFAEGVRGEDHDLVEHVAASVINVRNKPERFLKEKEVGQLLGLSVKTLQLYRYEGRGPTYCRLGGKRAIRYRLGALLEWAAKYEVRGDIKP